jgi:hypothetical protein
MRARIQATIGTAIDNTINQGLKDGCDILQQMHNWRFMEASTTMTVSEGATTFSLPDDFKEELNPEISDYEGSGYRRLVKIIKNGIDKRSTSGSGRPLQYRIWEEQGKFLIDADDGFTFPMEYYKYFEDIADDETSDSDFQTFLNKAHEAIEHFAMARCYERVQNFKIAQYYQNDDFRFPLGKFELKFKQLKKEDEEIALANVDLQMGYPG